MWPGVSELPEFSPTFPKWPQQQLGRYVKRLSPEGVDLLSVRGALRAGATDPLSRSYIHHPLSENAHL